jgi:hypothetical protein
MINLHLLMHGFFIVFFAWLLLHSLIYSKSSVIEGLETTAPTTTTTPTITPTTSATTTTPTTSATTTTTPTTTPTTSTPTQVQIDENTAEIAILKGQIATLMQTAQTLKVQLLQNEIGVQNNTNSIQKVVQSQTDMRNKLSNAKSTK